MPGGGGELVVKRILLPLDDDGGVLVVASRCVRGCVENGDVSVEHIGMQSAGTVLLADVAVLGWIYKHPPLPPTATPTSSYWHKCAPRTQQRRLF